MCEISSGRQISIGNTVEIVRVAVISTVITIEKQKLKARSHPPPTLRDAKYNPSYTSTYSF